MNDRMNNRRILIVDDEPAITEELSDYLREEGYEVATALDGKGGLKFLETFQPEVVLTDLKLPDMSGLEILATVRRSYPNIKVIVCTGYVDQQLIDEAERLERDAFIQKPFDLEFIRGEIDKLLSG